MKETLIDKLDEFMSVQEPEMFEAAKREVLNDPTLVETRVAMKKVADIVADFRSQDDVNEFSNAKLEEACRTIDALKAQLRIVEARNVKLASKNSSLTEQVKDAEQVITEAAKVERKERMNRRGTASGRGKRVMQNDQEIISEYVQPTTPANREPELTEAHDPLNDLLVLSGLQDS